MDNMCRCDGSGKLRYHHVDPPRRGLMDGEEVVVTGETWGSTPCPCRSSLSPRAGEAAWWTTEQVFYEAVEVCGEIGLEITVEAEVPYSRDNYKLHRKGNRYYPTMPSVVWGDPIVIHAEDCERIADAFRRAGEACRKIDAPDEAPCGHWAPCDCEREHPLGTAASEGMGEDG